MMTFDTYDEESREGARRDMPAQQLFAALRSLAESGVDVTGSESGAELTLMQTAVDAFRRAAEALAGRNTGTHAGTSEDLCKHVVPPRAADETPRQYTERVNRMTERFRSLMQESKRDRPR